ncbi:MAG: type III pantothenate kinase [Vulcanibacillus sp.]
MILVIDVGNTNITLGVYKANQLREYWRISTDRNKTADEYGMLFKLLFEDSNIFYSDIEGIIISSVVPPLVSTLEKMSKKYMKHNPLIVEPGIKTGLKINLENPKEVGADRIVNAIAAIEIYGAPLIIVDFGTATSFDYIDEYGTYQGGAIAPGISISTEALFERAAKLPRVDLVKPESVIGKNTVNAMQSGIIFGFAGQVDAIVERMVALSIKKPNVIATGGLAELIASESKAISITNPFLTLEGLKMIYDRNSK